MLGTSVLGTAGLGLVGVVAAAGLAVRAFQLATLVHEVGLGAGVDSLVELVVVGAGAVLAAWLGLSALVASVCLGARVAGHVWRGGERIVARLAPAVVRRMLTVTVAAGLGLGTALGAQAASPPVPAADVVQQEPGDLGWPVTDTPPADPTSAPSLPSAPSTPVPDEPAAPTAPAEAAATPAVAAPDGAGAGAAGQVVVQPGDTLWGIARRYLPEGASPSQIAAAWPAWYEANRETVGPDPDLIRPGQVLEVPVMQR